MPEQEFLPPRPSARSPFPDRDDEDLPPWANLPPVRPARDGPGAEGDEDVPRAQPRGSRGPGGRALRAAARRRRRWLVMAGGLAPLLNLRRVRIVAAA